MRTPAETEADQGQRSRPPILDHPLFAPTVFSPGDLIAAVRAQRGLASDTLPEVCVLDFDGDLTDGLVKSGEATPCAGWPCFHTAMWTIEVDSPRCGLIPRTIGGPYAVLVAEQLAACGVRVVLGLASAGRIHPAASAAGDRGRQPGSPRRRDVISLLASERVGRGMARCSVSAGRGTRTAWNDHPHRHRLDHRRPLP